MVSAIVRDTRYLPAAAAVLVVLVALAAPEPVVLGGQRLAAYATIVAGASLLVARIGAADLALAAAVAVGAYTGGVLPALAGLPVAVGLGTGVLAGAAAGALAGSVHGRLGRTMGALASLAVASAAVAVLSAWPTGGGVAGFHAVALPTPWGVRADLLAVGLVLAVALVVATAWSRRPAAALGALAVRAPGVVLALGARPAVTTARTGAVAGALCGLGGWSLATVTGSVMPDAYGLQLAAALALAALVGGVGPWGPLVGTGVVWGPSTLWPLAPVVGTAPPLLVAGPLGVVLLALTRGRPLTDLAPAGPAPTRAGATLDEGPGEAPTPAGGRDGSLRLDDLDVLGRRVSFGVDAGEVVALTGPNGAGKSTLLAMVGGQVGDGGRVEIGARRAPRGARARAHLGVARTWQQVPHLPAADLRAVVAAEPVAARAGAWARGVLGGEPDDDARGQLVLLAAQRPALALLDEPTDVAPEPLLAFVRGLAAGGAAVLLVDHRPEVVAAADRTVELAP
jgi:ABC-type branched-subunit amino acid transport system permease subunit